MFQFPSTPVVQSVHDLSYPGTKATAKLVAQRFIWAGVQKDCPTWALACQPCQRSKVTRHIVTPFGDFTPPAAPFPARPHRLLGAPSDFSGVHILPHCS
jgi:hypothetical protein